MITKTAVYLTKFADDAGILDSLSSMGYNALGKAYNAAHDLYGKAGNYLREGVAGWKNVINGLSTQPGRTAVLDQGVLAPVDKLFGTTFSSAKKALSNIPPKVSIEEKAAQFKKKYNDWKRDHWYDFETQKLRPGGKWVRGEYVPPDLLPSLSGIGNKVKSFFTGTSTTSVVQPTANPVVNTAKALGKGVSA